MNQSWPFVGGPAMHQVLAPQTQRLLLENVDWRTYERLLRALDDRPSLRLTYDRGVLEIMSPLHEHDSDARFLGRLVITLTEELGQKIKAGGSTTYRRRRRRRGLEPDESFWIGSEPLVRGKRDIDLRIDPPPDLCIEIDVTHSSLDRMSIYANLGVPEVWRLDEQGLTFQALQPDRTYVAVSHSRAFPFLTPVDPMTFLALRSQLDENEVVHQFRDWVRQNRPSAPPP
jgi:Uma2 family endonuclease